MRNSCTSVLFLVILSVVCAKHIVPTSSLSSVVAMSLRGGTSNRSWRLRSRPVGAIKDTDLELCTEDKPAIADGQVLVRNEYISIDPTQRIWMSDKAQFMDPVNLGDVMRAATVGVIEESKSADFPVGAHVVGFGGCCDYYAGIPGVNVMYKAGELGDLPLTGTKFSNPAV
jgi:hypothetical protein